MLNAKCSMSNERRRKSRSLMPFEHLTLDMWHSAKRMHPTAARKACGTAQDLLSAAAFRP
jgi:hypothetical protein